MPGQSAADPIVIQITSPTGFFTGKAKVGQFVTVRASFNNTLEFRFAGSRPDKAGADTARLKAGAVLRASEPGIHKFECFENSASTTPMPYAGQMEIEPGP